MAGGPSVCLILYFISSSTCAYWQCSFFVCFFFAFLRLPHTHTRSISHDSCRSVCGCWVVQHNVPRVHVQPRHTCADPLLLFFAPPLPQVLCSMQEKIDIHWSIAKWSKYCPHQKSCESSEQELNQSLNIKVELSGRKSIIKKTNKQKKKKRCCFCKHLKVTHRGHMMQMTTFPQKVMIMLGTLYIHTTWWAGRDIIYEESQKWLQKYK